MGDYRKIQNFIGPSKRIEDAVYIPIGANDISNYMTNLDYFINSTKHRSFEKSDNNSGKVDLDEHSDILIKTVIMHAQFESIHPFLDGNGRMGRILIVLNTMLDNLIEEPVFFVSEELEKERLRYYNLLNGTRGEQPDWYSWIEFFLEACDRMAEVMLMKLDGIIELVEKGLSVIDKGNSMINRVWLETFQKTYVTAAEVASSLDMAPGTARGHLNSLVELRLIDVDQSKTKNKVYVNYDLLRRLN